MAVQSQRQEPEKRLEFRYKVGDQVRINTYRDDGPAQTLLSVTRIEPDDSYSIQYFNESGEVAQTLRFDRFGRRIAG